MEKIDFIKGGKILATFMDYPTKSVRGRITDLLASKMYRDWNSIMTVVDKIEKLNLDKTTEDPNSYFAIVFNISGGWIDITVFYFLNGNRDDEYLVKFVPDDSVDGNRLLGGLSVLYSIHTMVQ